MITRPILETLTARYPAQVRSLQDGLALGEFGTERPYAVLHFFDEPPFSASASDLDICLAKCNVDLVAHIASSEIIGVAYNPRDLDKLVFGDMASRSTN